MENVKLDKVERNKIWEAMLEAGIIIKKPTCKKLRDEQYQLHKRLKKTDTIQSIQLMRTILFFYDKYHQSISSSDSNQKSHEEQLKEQRKIFHKKLQDKENEIRNLRGQIGDLNNKIESLQKQLFKSEHLLNEMKSEADKYKTANKVLNQRLEVKKSNEVKPEPERIDNYNNSCIVTSSGDSDDELPPDYYKKLQATL
jgi:chromosome segregation ATPase